MVTKKKQEEETTSEFSLDVSEEVESKESLEKAIREKIEAELRSKIEAEFKLKAKKELAAKNVSETIEKPKKAPVVRHAWSPELRTVVTGMKHPTFDDETGVSLRTMETEQEAESFRNDLTNLDTRNQMSLLKPNQYAWYGIERRVINGVTCLAQTSNPFLYRIQKFTEEMQNLKTAESSTVGELQKQLDSMKEQFEQFKHLNSNNDPSHETQLGLESDMSDELQYQIEQSKMIEGETEGGTTSSSRALG